MPRKNLQKEKDSQSSNKTQQEKASKFSHMPSRSTQLKPLSEQLTLTLKKRKGRQRTQTSLVVFELDEKSIDWVLGDDKATVVQNLYEMTREGEKPLFISKRVDVLNRLQNEIPYFVETEVLKEQGAREELQEEVMNLILKHVTDKMQPDTSTYVGTLFTQDDMSGQPFSFGTVCTPSDYFSQPQPTVDIIAEEEKEEKVEDQTSSRSSPVRPSEMEIEHETKDLDSSFFSRPDSIKTRPFDDIDSSQTSSQKRMLFPIPELQERQTSYYYSKIKDLNTLISCKLTSRFEKIKAKAEQDIVKGTPSPTTKMSLTDFDPDSGKRQRDFEEDIFDVYASQEVTKPKFENDIFDSAENTRDNKEISNKLKNIQFEALDASDTNPIIKKLKGPDSVKRGQPLIDPTSKLNDIILEYKAAIPGERQVPIQIFGRDLQKLETNSYINDTIIQFYLKLIQSEFLDESRKGSVYIYNTYLIEKLRSSTKKGEFETGGSSDFEKIYNSVKKWTKDVDIFEKDFLLFPAHDKNQKHWSLFVVCYPQYFLVKEESQSQNPEPSTKPKMKPFMLYFDSFKLMDTETAKLISLYLEHEVMNKKPEIYGPIKQAFNSIREYRMHQLIVPLQENYTDCAAYLLEYAERFLMNPDEILDDVEHDRNKLHLFPRSIFKSKRTDIKNLILAMASGDKNVLAEYPRKKQMKIDASMDMPDNFITINDNDFKTYLRTKFDADVQELDSKTRDRAKLGFLIQSHEQKMARSTDKTVIGNKK